MSDNDSAGSAREKLRNASIEPNSTSAPKAFKAMVKPKDLSSGVGDQPGSTSFESIKSRPKPLRAKRAAKERNVDKSTPSESDASGGSSVDDEEEKPKTRKRSRSAEDADDETENVRDRKKRISPASSSVDEDRLREKTPPAAKEVDTMASPKGKRTREDFLLDSIDAPAPRSPEKDSTESDSEAERTAKRKREASTVATPIAEASSADKLDKEGSKASSLKLNPSSGFGNTSGASPFASFASPSKEAAKPQVDTAPKDKTSQSAFEASSFSKLAQSSTSPFTSIGGASTASPFGGFGSTSTASPFASTTSSTSKPGAWGGLGGGTFAAASSFGGGSSSPWASATSKPSVFGSSSSTSAFGTTAPPPITGLSAASKPFGAPQNVEDDDDDDGSDDDTDEDDEDEETSFVEKASSKHHELKSGEEDEFTVFLSRAKLYQFAGGQWKECGYGTFKFNVLRLEDDPHDVGLENILSEVETLTGDDEEAGLVQFAGEAANGKEAEKKSDEPESGEKLRRKARFIHRMDQSGRLVLNTAVTSNLIFGGDAKGSEPSSATLLFMGTLAAGEDGEMARANLLLKVRYTCLSYP
jgi:Ran-binding protein 3